MKWLCAKCVGNHPIQALPVRCEGPVECDSCGHEARQTEMVAITDHEFGEFLAKHDPIPIVVRCKICGENIQLEPTSEDVPGLWVDPSRQIRRHVLEHGAEVISLVANWTADLTDSLVFTPVQNKRAWHRGLVELLDHLAEADVEAPKV